MDSKREDEGFEAMINNPVVMVEHDNSGPIRYHTLTLKNGMEVSVVPLATLVKMGLVKPDA